MKVSVIILITIGFYSCGQIGKSNNANNVKTVDSIIINEDKIKIDSFSFDNYVHTEADYTDSTGKGIIIQNSYPRGGGYIYTPSTIRYGHAVFWTRIINRTETPLVLNINFPADSFNIVPSADAHFKLLIPPNRMTLDKVTAFSFGLEGLDNFIANNFYQPSELQKTLLPNEETIFYVILLSHLSISDHGISRTGLFLQGKDLVYRLTVNPSISKLMPCGQIAFRD